MTQEQFEAMHQIMEDKKIDNDCGAWSESERQWAIDNGLIVGNGTTIEGQPNYMWASGVTREQLVVMLCRYAKMTGNA